MCTESSDFQIYQYLGSTFSTLGDKSVHLEATYVYIKFRNQ